MDVVLKLKKSLYGTKQASRLWQQKLRVGATKHKALRYNDKALRGLDPLRASTLRLRQGAHRTCPYSLATGRWIHEAPG